MKIVLASRNPNKVRELRTLLSETIPDLEILSLEDVGSSDPIEENGATFEENALIKARVAANSGYIGVGDDSGLCVDCLNGAPGIYSARYAAQFGTSDAHNDAANNELLIRQILPYPSEQRTARFVCAMACVFPNGDEWTVRGEAEGHILTEYRGKDGFGYDPLFFFDALQKTFAELTPEEKNAVSHRGNAMRLFSEKLRRSILSYKKEFFE